VNSETRGGSACVGPSRFFLVCALLGAALAAGACAAKPNTPHPTLATVWRDYRELPDKRAIAIAGNLRQNRYVVGASGGHATFPDAEAAALRECQARRQKLRQQAACHMYAIGNEIVWQGQ
jgi:hypothetical protein